MKNQAVWDKIWGSVLVGLPVLGIVLGLIPGMVKVYDAQLTQYINANLFSAPDLSVMSLLGKVVLMVFGFTAIVAVLYARGQSINMLKGVMVMSIASCAVSALALLPNQTITVWPYVILPVLMGVESVLSVVLLIIESKKIDY